MQTPNPTSPPGHLLTSLPPSFSLNKSGFIGKILLTQLTPYSGPHYKLTTEQLIALTLNDTAAEQERGKVFWLTIGGDPVVLYADHTWNDEELNEYLQLSNFERLERCCAYLHRLQRVQHRIIGLPMKIIVLPRGSDILHWEENHGDQDMFQMLFIYRAGKVYLTRREEWDCHTVLAGGHKYTSVGVSAAAFQKSAQRTVSVSIHLNTEGAEDILAGNEMCSNVEILRKLEDSFVEEKSLSLAHVRAEAKNGKCMVQ